MEVRPWRLMGDCNKCGDALYLCPLLIIGEEELVAMFQLLPLKNMPTIGTVFPIVGLPIIGNTDQCTSM